MATLWLRAEVPSRPPRGVNLTPQVDPRTPLAPDDAAALVRAGVRVVVERSAQRVFSDDLYEAAGCSLAEAGTWPDAPRSALVLGLRGLPLAQTPTPLHHTHAYFAHAFKDQTGWYGHIERFAQGGGALLDLEYLVDAAGHRVVNFGVNAGMIGLAGAVLAWCRQVLGRPVPAVDVPADLMSRLDNMPLESHLRGLVDLAAGFAGRRPCVLVIGAGGRTGKGAAAFAKRLELDTTEWSRKDTERGGPFPEILTDFDILVNAIKLDETLAAPFVTQDMIRKDSSLDRPRTLTVILDMSCDVKNPRNPLPIYGRTTTFDQPTLRLVDYPTPLDVIAIPNLPSLLASDSSRDFSAQLLPHLLAITQHDGPPTTAPVWNRAYASFAAVAARVTPSADAPALAEYPASLAQARIVTVERTLRGTPFVSLAAAPCAAGLTLDQLTDRAAAAAARHEALRTRIDLPRCVVASAADASSVYAVEQCPAGVDLAAHLVAVSQEISALAGDKRPVWRAVLAGSQVGVALHAAIGDVASARLLAAHLASGAAAAAAAEPPLQLSQIAPWHRSLWGSVQVPTSEAINVDGVRDHYNAAEARVLEALTAWKAALSGSPPVLQIPVDHTRPAKPTFVCANVTAELPAALREGLAKLLGPVGPALPPKSARIACAVLTAFQAVLHRHSREEDVIVSAQTPGRLRPALAGAIGPFSNQVPLRATLDASTTFAALLKQTAAAWATALGHQEAPLERILDTAAVPEHEGNPVPLSKVAFDCAALWAAADADADADADSAAAAIDTVLSPFDLTLRLGPAGSLVLAYNKDLVDAPRAAEILQQLVLLLEQAAADSARPVLKYSLITAQAAKALPDPTQPLDSTYLGSIYAKFTENAAKFPDRPAVVFEGRITTYRELDELTNQLANALIAAGIQKEEAIGLYGHRSPAVVWAIMGILKAGAAYTMMDPAYPFSRISACLNIAKIRGWVRIGAAGDVPAELQQFLDEKDLKCQICLPALEDAASAEPAVAKQPTTNPNVEVGPENVAVVTFTSGSTGLPKGVMGRHGPLTHFYPFMGEQFGLDETDRYSLCSGIAHDPLQRDVFTPLFFGATIYVPTQDTVVTPGELAEWMHAQKVTSSCLTPAMGQLLTTNDNPTFAIASLRTVFFVGDCLIKRDVHRLRKLAPNVRCINMYGSTETQRSVGFFEVPDDAQLALMKEVIPGGVGMRDAEVLILNDAGEHAGVGETAEIYVRSHFLAKGYIGLDDQTKAKFLPNPFTGTPGDRLYKTGDLGRYMLDGNVECAGRADDQVKIRGFRIELGEVNAHLSKHMSVKENVTIVREDVPGDKKIVSYVVPTEFDASGARVEGDIDPAQLVVDLRAFLADKLPSYMVPTSIVILQSMPLTPNAKINRAALPKPEDGGSGAGGSGGNIGSDQDPHQHLHPLTGTEAKLVTIWSQVLNQTIRSLEDNFFDLGGHSLTATQLNLRMRQEFALKIPMRLIFDLPTIASIAPKVDEMLGGADATPAPAQAATPDLAAHVALDETLVVAADADRSLLDKEGPLSAVFLTGGSGFLGSFLLRDLLEETEATIYCHVRAASVDEGHKRLCRNLEAHQVWKSSYEARIVAVPGDLALPLLGIDEARFAELAGTVEAVVHNAAYVHWLLPFEKLKATNVQGTQEALRMAFMGRPKPFHHVSTTSVFDTTHHGQLETVSEEDALEQFAGLGGGYPQSKWVAEKVVMLARERGLPTSIYRPGYVTGESSTGVWNVDDFLCRFVKACIQLGKAPEVGSATIDMSPVDYVSRATIRLALQKSSQGHGFHLVNPNLFTYQKMYAAIRAFGFKVEVVPYEAWRTALFDAVTGGADNALSPLLSHFGDGWANAQRNPEYQTRNVAAGLEGSGVECPLIDALLVNYFSYFVSCEFLPQPASDDATIKIDWKMIGDGVKQLSRSGRS